jgi:2-keto-3-deoxy-L-fuconate dehydrogenase
MHAKAALPSPKSARRYSRVADEMTMHRVQGKRILVTAAAQGIGRACAEVLHQEGADVLATDIDSDGLAALRESGIRTAIMDATMPSAVAQVVSKEGAFGALVHCVGRVHSGTILECDEVEWSRSFKVNVDSFYCVLRAVLPGMLTAKTGSIVCISSVVSSLRGLPNRAAYGTTKAALNGLVKAVAADYISQGIRCNAVCPGTVDSPSLRERVLDLSAKLGSVEAARNAFIARQPMGRLGTPREIADLCLYLASDESAFLTGQLLPIDGGLTI